MKKLFIVLMAGMFLLACNSNTKTDATEDTAAPAVAAEWVEVVINVNGMTCDGCENAIRKGIETLDGIATVESSHEKGWTKVKFDKNQTSQAQIEEKISDTGYSLQSEQESESL